MARDSRYANGHRRRQVRAWCLKHFDTCALCGKPIDKSLKTPHPMSAEVDEIVPVSLGGSPYERDNCRLVHRICNQRRGNGKRQAVKKGLELPLPTSRRW